MSSLSAGPPDRRAAVNPYSPARPASSRVFKGYAQLEPGHWTLQEIVECMVSSPVAPPSFWIQGERKLGKTSYLLRLQQLLIASSRRPGHLFTPIPLYLCCKGHSSLLSFYEGVFQCLGRLSETIGVLREATSPTLAASLERGRLLKAGADPALTEHRLLEALIADLEQLRQPLGDQVRFVLLVDHPEAAVEKGWADALFGHLRLLITDDVARSPGGSWLSSDRMAVVVAGAETIHRSSFAARGLLAVVEEVALRSLKWREVRELVDEPIGRRAENELISRICWATGGHPWLLQYVLEELFDVLTGDDRQLDPHFDAILSRFPVSRERSDVLAQWLSLVPQDEIDLLTHLSLAGEDGGVGLRELSARTNLHPEALQPRLGQLQDLGIAYEPNPGRYLLSGLFRKWFLRHTGGGVLMAEVERLRSEQAEALRRAVPEPFRILLSIEPNLIVADGLTTRLIKVGSTLARSFFTAGRWAVRSRDLAALDDLANETLNNLLQPDQWLDLWGDYTDVALATGGEPSFVFRFDDARLLDFPIELVKVAGTFLGLRSPVCKQLLGQGPSQLLANDRQLRDEPLDVLLVSSSVTGEYKGRKYSPLPLADEEVVEIATRLASGEAESLVVRRVVLLTNSPGIQGIETHSATLETFEKALTGGFGGRFGLVHYSGHYLEGEGKSGGFLLGGDHELRLFTLARFEQSLGPEQKLVTLNACRSASHDEQGAYYLGAAHSALRGGASAVIAMRWPVADSDALLFSRCFYRALAGPARGRPEIALWHARKEMEADSDTGIAWAAPVMLTR